MRGAVQVFILIGIHRPQKSRKTKRAEAKRNRDQIDDDLHSGTPPIHPQCIHGHNQ